MIEYKVNDWAKLDQYFIGKKPSTKQLFLLGLKSNFGAVCGGDLAPYQTLIHHSQKLQKLGVIKRIIKKSPPSKYTLEKPLRELREKARKKIMTMTTDELNSFLSSLGGDENV